MEVKVLERFALNDVVHWAEWQTDKLEITLSVRYAGSSSDGTIHFQGTRWTSRLAEPAESSGFGMVIPRLPTVFTPKPPDQLRLSISPTSESASIAAATWRVGAGNDDIDYKYYAVGEHGELLEVEAPTSSGRSSKTEIGFRHGSEKLPD
jgi:hypothetical protein